MPPQQGTIKNYDPVKGMGRIVTDQGVIVYFTKDKVSGGEPQPGTRVTFESRRNPQGREEATHVGIPQSYGGKSGGPGQPNRGWSDRGGERRPEVALPQEGLFDGGFYDQNGCLRMELFFQAPEKMAECFRRAGLNPTQFRMLYQSFLGFAGLLREGRISFEKARERFGVFYAERVVRQAKRGMVPAVVKAFIDRHRDLILSDRNEMLGFFRYLTNVYCYFGDKDDNQRR